MREGIIYRGSSIRLTVDISSEAMEVKKKNKKKKERKKQDDIFKVLKEKHVN